MACEVFGGSFSGKRVLEKYLLRFDATRSVLAIDRYSDIFPRTAWKITKYDEGKV